MASSSVMFFASGTMLSKTAPRTIRRWFHSRRSSRDSFCRKSFSLFSNWRIFFFPSSISAVSSSKVFVLGFVMGGRSFLPVGIEKGQSIFSAALVGGYSILVCCFQIYKIACCSAIAIFSIPFSCYFINISAQFKSEYVSNNSYIFAVCSRLSPMFVTPALHT